jgi:hypothetical protein
MPCRGQSIDDDDHRSDDERMEHSHDRGCSRENSFHAEGSAEVLRRDSVIIFDWDDTLMWSSEIKAEAKTSREDLRQLEQAVGDLLRTAIDLGTTAIVTNANLGWVQATASLFLPSLLPLLQLVQITSARQLFETKWPGDAGMWKKEAFKQLLDRNSPHSVKGPAHRGDEANDVCSLLTPRGMADATIGACNSGRADGHDGLNLIVLGDSMVDIQAGHSALRPNDSVSVVKTVKFKQTPTASELLGQLQVVNKHMKGLVEEDRTINKKLVNSAWTGWTLTETTISLEEDSTSRRTNTPC